TRRIRPPTAPTARRPPSEGSPGETATRRRFPRWRAIIAAAALLAAALVAVLVIALSSGGSGSSGGGAAKAGGGAAQTAQPVPQLDDTAAEARALANWLRAQGR
ncbi:MAG: hypothetical protein ACRDK5_06200, partial [Solirubrobacterales bacterium]